MSFLQDGIDRMESAAALYHDQAQLFFSMLTMDDRNSYYVLSSDESGAWTDTPIKRVQLSLKRFDSSHNYYITHNGFSEKRRRLQGTRQLNALFYDLDCHSATESECRRLVREAQSRIQKAVEQGDFPQPSMIVDSGRGLHLYYVLQRSIPYRLRQGEQLAVNEKGLSYFQDVQGRLADILDDVLAGLDGLTVDRAVFDYTRVSRIPGTYNAKAKRYAQLVGGSHQPWNLSDLAVFHPNKAVVNSTTESKKPRIITFNRLMMFRLRKIAELQEYRDFKCEGSRELISFVYYNTAVQIYQREDAKERLAVFNARFKTPLVQTELNGIYSAVDTVVNVKGETGYYILKADTLVRLLSLTERELEELHFFASKRFTDRLEAKHRTHEKRERRNARVCELYSQGTMTQQEVANAVGCSVRTVCAILKENGLTRRTVAAQADSQPPFDRQDDRAMPSTESAVARPLAEFFQSAIFCQPCLKGSVIHTPLDRACCMLGGNSLLYLPLSPLVLDCNLPLPHFDFVPSTVFSLICELIHPFVRVSWTSLWTNEENNCVSAGHSRSLCWVDCFSPMQAFVLFGYDSSRGIAS